MKCSIIKYTTWSFRQSRAHEKFKVTKHQSVKHPNNQRKDQYQMVVQKQEQRQRHQIAFIQKAVKFCKE